MTYFVNRLSGNIFTRLVTATFARMANLTLAEERWMLLPYIKRDTELFQLNMNGGLHLWTHLDVTWTREGQLLHGDKRCYLTRSGSIRIRKSELVCIRLKEFISLKISIDNFDGYTYNSIRISWHHFKQRRGGQGWSIDHPDSKIPPF